MTESLRFQTRARTIDHLGREQIADCPTAVSELWKNSYDAYAQSASLNIFDGEHVVAAIYDDGHGMSRSEFINKWLVVGTESKVVLSSTSTSDRNGLPYRTRQGKKGIGRLSIGYLGNLLLLVTKREVDDYVAALIDWRVFENPYLLLDDIRIPSVTFQEKEALLGELPQLFDILMGNVWGDSNDDKRKERIIQAWKDFDKIELESAGQMHGGNEVITTRARIEQTLINETFAVRHLSEWEVWSEKSKHGTALVISGVIPDIEAQLHPNSQSATDQTSRESLRSTLWSFIDPFRELTREPHEATIEDFTANVVGWRGEQRIPIIDRASGFQAHSAANLEHIIDGWIDDAGTFRGRVKAFGVWLDNDVEIKFGEAVSSRADSRVGEFDFYVGTMEFEKANTTLTDETFSHLTALLEKYSGLMVFRDGFRVMPYGRPDSDYFGVEERRSKNAGREFWNHRRMLGRIAISSYNNSNLKDKAGREGIIDNRASKVFRAIVINVLTTSARLYFGSASDIRKEKLPSLNAAYDARQKAEERERMTKQKRRQFRTRLEGNYPVLEGMLSKVETLRQRTATLLQEPDEAISSQIHQNVTSLKQEQSTLRLGTPPKDLSSRLRNTYNAYRGMMQEIDESLRAAEKEVNEALERVSPKSPRELAQKEVDSQLGHIRRRLSRWINKIEALFESEKQRITTHAKGRMELLTNQIGTIPKEVESETVKLTKALAIISDIAAQNDTENELQMEPIIAALESLSENINLDLLAGDSAEEVGSLRSEVDRLTALAQLGITVEIIDHELASFNSTIAHGLDQFPESVRETRPYRQVRTAYDGLASRLSFLSPLKLSGEPDYGDITGYVLEHYLLEFFSADIGNGTFQIVATEQFRKFSVYELKSRVYPVFINLVNNARYWLQQKRVINPVVMLSVQDDKVLVSDNGPGIDPQDVPDLFRLFFSRRQGGRGVGLYLCRSNLAAGGHKIYYATDDKPRPQQGATFAIEFRNATFSL